MRQCFPYEHTEPCVVLVFVFLVFRGVSWTSREWGLTQLWLRPSGKGSGQNWCGLCWVI